MHTSDIKPDFLIIGAAKAATTTLSNILASHEDVAFSKVKEPQFFSVPQQYARGFGWYSSLFPVTDKTKAIGEGSTSYSRIRQYPGLIERIHLYRADMKIIYMVRHPLDRIRSAFLEWVSTPAFSGQLESLDHAVRMIPMMIDSSRYYETYQAYASAFGEEQIKVVWFEDFVSNTASEFADVCDFLGIEPAFVTDFSSIKSNTADDVMTRLQTLGRTIDHAALEWTESAKTFVLQELAGDPARMLKHFGKPDDYWD